MPPRSNGTFRASTQWFRVVARTLPGDHPNVRMCLAGEIDIAAAAALARTVDWLTALAPVSVLVDLAELTFAGATLPNFVVQVRQAMPDGAELILWRPRAVTGWVLRVTHMAAIATLTDEPGLVWSDPPLSPALRPAAKSA